MLCQPSATFSPSSHIFRTVQVLRENRELTTLITTSFYCEGDRGKKSDRQREQNYKKVVEECVFNVDYLNRETDNLYLTN